jgi:hypothetical protein
MSVPASQALNMHSFNGLCMTLSYSFPTSKNYVIKLKEQFYNTIHVSFFNVHHHDVKFLEQSVTIVMLAGPTMNINKININ